MVKDFILNSSGDLDVSADGDLKVGFSDNQHIEHVVVSSQSNYKQHPLVGVNARSYINSPVNSTNSIAFKRNAKLQLEADKAEVQSIETGKEWVLNIKAEYINE